MSCADKFKLLMTGGRIWQAAGLAATAFDDELLNPRGRFVNNETKSITGIARSNAQRIQRIGDCSPTPADMLTDLKSMVLQAQPGMQADTAEKVAACLCAAYWIDRDDIVRGSGYVVMAMVTDDDVRRHHIRRRITEGLRKALGIPSFGEVVSGDMPPHDAQGVILVEDGVKQLYGQVVIQNGIARTRRADGTKARIDTVELSPGINARDFLHDYWPSIYDETGGSPGISIGRSRDAGLPGFQQDGQTVGRQVNVGTRIGGTVTVNGGRIVSGDQTDWEAFEEDMGETFGPSRDSVQINGGVAGGTVNVVGDFVGRQAVSVQGQNIYVTRDGKRINIKSLPPAEAQRIRAQIEKAQEDAQQAIKEAMQGLNQALDGFNF